MLRQHIRPVAWPFLALALLTLPFTVRSAAPAGPRFGVRGAAGVRTGPLDGRLLLLVSRDESQEPRFQIEDGPKSQQAFGIDVDGWAPGTAAHFEPGVLGYPLESLRDLPAGTYTVRALLHRYETFHRSDGHTVKLPMDRGEGQQWNRAPGNFYSKPVKMALDGTTEPIRIVLDQEIPPIAPPEDTRYIRH